VTINELFDEYNIKYEVTKRDKGIQLYKIGKTNLLIWLNDGNVFKLKREWFNALITGGDRYSLLLIDKTVKKYYYLKFNQRNNWFSEGFLNCDKTEIFLGKQVLNYEKTMNLIITDLVKSSNE